MDEQKKQQRIYLIVAIGIAALSFVFLAILQPNKRRIEHQKAELIIEITQSVSTNMVLDVDKNHLNLIVRNLLQNALKFTHTGGKIHFESSDTEGVQKLTIQDNGIGISPETIAQLFKIDKNTQCIGTAKEGGTGLGLVLTKGLVELNGGAITVMSEEGKALHFLCVFEKEQQFAVDIDFGAIPLQMQFEQADTIGFIVNDNCFQ